MSLPATLPFQIGDKETVKIESIGYGGRGVARPQGFVLLIPRTAPGDQVRVEITDLRRRYGTAIPLEIMEPSPQRAKPPCPLFEECGGCHYQHLTEETQRQLKRDHLLDALTRFGPGEVEVRPVIEPKQRWNYRNRLIYHRSEEGTQGYVSWKSGRVVDVSDCPVAQKDLNLLWQKLLEPLRTVPSTLLPYVLLRRTTKGERAVMLSFAQDARRKEIESIINLVTEIIPRSVSIWAAYVSMKIHRPVQKKIERFRGPEFLTETIGSLNYLTHPHLFFQTHPEITATLIQSAVTWAKEKRCSRILDLYCGSGLFTLPLAQAGHSVLGVEVDLPLIQTAKRSAQENGVVADFRSGKCDRIVHRLCQEGETFDTAIVDPPRKGLSRALIEDLKPLGIQKILYVSCSPPTLARDLKLLSEKGYRAEWIQPLEMFPQTYHIETATSLVLD